MRIQHRLEFLAMGGRAGHYCNECASNWKSNIGHTEAPWEKGKVETVYDGAVAIARRCIAEPFDAKQNN
jgi:hypothetical protein